MGLLYLAPGDHRSFFKKDFFKSRATENNKALYNQLDDVQNQLKKPLMMMMMMRFLNIVTTVVWLFLIIPSIYSLGTGDNSNDNNNDNDTDDNINIPDYLIIGAGSSGIQTALFLKKYHYSYTILERNSQVGSFWSTFPRFRELISVNKWVRNETHRLRYDWHSMLETDIQMQDITQDYFPQANDYQRYMQRVAEKANLNIEFGKEVASLAADDNTPCVTLMDRTKRCAKYRVFVGTGLQEKPEPYLRALGGIPYSQITKQMTYHRIVCILGNGNSAFEIAQNVGTIADRITMYGRHLHRFSSITRYTGDVRIKFAQALENFHGKLLDTVDHFSKRPIIQGPEIPEQQLNNMKDMLETTSWLKRFNCETFVIATGFESNVPGMTKTMKSRRFPPTNDWYTWKENSKIHFIGYLMHEYDFRKGSGGFFSGFRYLIRNLVHHVREEDFGIPYPYDVLTKKQVMERALSRFQTASDLVILQDAITIKDVVIKANDQQSCTNSEDGDELYHYYEGITYKFYHNFMKEQQQQKDVMSLYFAWGDGRQSSRVFEGIYRYNDTGTLINLFLHPVVEVNNNGDDLIRNMQEDTDMAWIDPSNVHAILKTVNDALNGNLTLFQLKKDFSYKPETTAIINHGDRPTDYEHAGINPAFETDFIKAIMKAAKSNGTVQDLNELRAAHPQWLVEVAAASSIV